MGRVTTVHDAHFLSAYSAGIFTTNMVTTYSEDMLHEENTTLYPVSNSATKRPTRQQNQATNIMKRLQYKQINQSHTA